MARNELARLMAEVKRLEKQVEVLSTALGMM